MRPFKLITCVLLLSFCKTKAFLQPTDTLRAFGFWMLSGYPSLHRNTIAGAGIMLWHKPARIQMGAFADLRFLNSNVVDTGMPGESLLRYSAPPHLRVRLGIAHWFSSVMSAMEGAYLCGWAGIYLPVNRPSWEAAGINKPAGIGGGISIGWLFPIGFNLVVEPAIDVLVSQVEKVYGGVVLRYRLAVGWRWATQERESHEPN